MKYIKTFEIKKGCRDLVFDDTYPFQLKQGFKTIDISKLQLKYGKNIAEFLTFLLYDKDIFFYSKTQTGLESEMVHGKVKEIRTAILIKNFRSYDSEFLHAQIYRDQNILVDLPIYSKIFTRGNRLRRSRSEIASKKI